MFTAENFREIFDIENRKGKDLARKFFPDLKSYNDKVKDKANEIRELRAKRQKINPQKFGNRITELKSEINELKSEKSSAIDEELAIVALNVQKPGFKVNLTKKIDKKGNEVFCIDSTPETYFLIRQLQRNIHRVYGVKQSNRHDLVSQLRDTITSTYPFEIVRTDISSFYENIDQEILLEELERDQLLSFLSKKHIRQLLNSYNSITGKQKGIPRGVGVSSYLAELYLRPVDKEIKKLHGLVLYCRYVDDIVAVFARPPTEVISGSYKDHIFKILSNRNLSHNYLKTKEFILNKTDTNKFEYLGYRFVIGCNKCNIWPSATKIRKYKFRLDAAFKDYEVQSSLASRRAFRDLVSRVKFLTGNTRLSNSKSSAVTGIYFNNITATNISSFEMLDKRLKNKIKKIKRKNLKRRLMKYKFSEGFLQRRYHKFNTRQLKSIVKVWKHG